MKKDVCTECEADTCEATQKGFLRNFRFLQNGLLHFPLTGKYYTFEEVIIESVKPCTHCAKSTYYIITKDGYRGMAVEFWECQK